MHNAGMSAASATAAPTNVIDQLYQDALGATGGAHYAAPFTRFETLGRTRSSWNHAAAFCTLGWLLYRRLWSQALLYSGLLQALLLLWFALLRPWLAPAQPIELGLALALLLLGCALPGLWGDALVYQDVRARTLQALAQAPTIAQARTTLQQQAPSRQRLFGLLALYLGAALALLASALWRAPPAYELVSNVPVPTAPVAPTPTPAPAPDAPAAEPAPVPAPTPAPVVDVAPPDTAAAIAPEPPPEPPAAPAPLLAAAAPPATEKPAEKTPPPHKAKDKEKTKEKTKEKAKETAKETAKGKAKEKEKPQPAAQVAHKATPAPAADSSGARHYVTIGVFADNANAQKVQKQLQKAKLPVQVQTVGTNKGEQFRVRAGPFHQTQEADKAAQRIRELGLEAVVLRQR